MYNNNYNSNNNHIGVYITKWSVSERRNYSVIFIIGRPSQWVGEELLKLTICALLSFKSRHCLARFLCPGKQQITYNS